MRTEELAVRIEAIESWDRSQCLNVWIAMTGVAPGSRLSARFIRKALIFELQCRRLGGHTAAVRRQLRAGVGLTTQRIRGLSVGTQLVREWNGRVYRVEVTADGFEMDGQTYASLSAVARRITGAEWSGPRFFGLKKLRS